MATNRQKAAQEKILADALALLAKNNVDTTGMKTYVETDFRNTEAVEVFIHQPQIFAQRRCLNCQKMFAHSQKIPAGTRVSFCSDNCRREDWRKNMRIDYDRVSTADPWDGDPPLIVNPVQYANLERIADWFNRNREELKIAADLQKEQERLAEADRLVETGQWDSPDLPTTTQDQTEQPLQDFEIFAETSTDQGDTQTNPDAWLFG